MGEPAALTKRRAIPFFALSLGLLCLGCDAKPEASPQANEGQVEEAAEPQQGAIKRRTVDDLPEVAEYGPPLDDSRLEVAPPISWSALPSSNLFLAGYSKEKTEELPKIHVTVAPSPVGNMMTLHEEDADEVAKTLEAELKAENPKRRIEEPCKPIILGDTVFIRHVRLAKLRGTPCVIQSLQTIQHGRLYGVDLIAAVEGRDPLKYESSLTKYRDYGYAVGANLKFRAPPSAAPAAAPAPAATPPADKPAETKPADAKADAKPDAAKPNP